MKREEPDITPEMIEAGVSALCLWETDEDPQVVCRSVFRAMFRALAAQNEPTR